MKKTVFLFALILMTFGVQQAFAQRVSATANFSSFDIDQASSGSTNIDYKGSTSLTLNLRYYTDKKWAIRVGAGLDQLSYTVENGDLSTDYTAQRQDLKGILGIEKHFIVANFLDIYPGAYIPVVLVGENIVQNNIDNIENGGVRAGLGVLLGANIKVLKIFRIGVEFDASYDHFKEGVAAGFNSGSFVPVRGINHTTNFTLGIAI
ncbi:MAG: hypothetical protein AAFR59_11310 [Bacteroidota bacterium]